MQTMKNIPIIFLTLLAGCVEQSPVASDAPVTVVTILAEEPPILGIDLIEESKPDPIGIVEVDPGQTLYKVIKIVGNSRRDIWRVLAPKSPACYYKQPGTQCQFRFRMRALSGLFFQPYCCSNSSSVSVTQRPSSRMAVTARWSAAPGELV